MDRDEFDKIIINNPGLKSHLRRTGEFSFTFFMWALWVYFCIPVLSIFLWALGVHIFYEEILSGGTLMKLQALMRNLGIFVLVVFLVLRSWGYYNFYKFGRRERRKRTNPVTIKRLSEDLSLSEAKIQQLQTERIIPWEFDSTNNLPPDRKTGGYKEGNPFRYSA